MESRSRRRTKAGRSRATLGGRTSSVAGANRSRPVSGVALGAGRRRRGCARHGGGQSASRTQTPPPRPGKALSIRRDVDMWLVVLAIIGNIVPGALFLYSLTHDYTSLSAALSDRLALAFL